MVRKKFTSEQVVEAANAIKLEGGIPSIRNVIERMGGGSPNRVGPWLLAWSEDQAGKGAHPVFVDAAVADAIARQIRGERAKATADVEAQLKAADDNVRLLSRRCDDCEEQLQATSTALEEARALCARQQGHQAAAEHEMKALRSTSFVTIEELRAGLASERLTIDMHRQQLARANLELEGLARTESARREAERQSAALAAELAAAREAASRAEATAEAATQGGREATTRANVLQGELAALQIKLSDAWQSERLLHVQMQKLTSLAATAQERNAVLEHRTRHLEGRLAKASITRGGRRQHKAAVPVSEETAPPSHVQADEVQP